MSDSSGTPDEYAILDQQLNRHRATMAKDVAFITILAGAMYADHRAHAAEMAELDALLNRVRTLQSLSAADRMAKRDEVLPGVKDDKTRGDRVRIACASIVQAEKGGATPNDPPMPNFAMSVFAHACDIIYDDLDVTELEKTFIRDIAKHLAIPPVDAAKIVEIISKKNEY
jgi:uncharacterized tellurite resistance protein B-like protein